MDLKQFLRKIIRILLPLALGCILLWYLYQDQDLGAMMKVAREGVRYDILLFSLIFGLGANIVRGLRWGLLIDSLGEKTRHLNVVLAVLGSYAINMALPRVGEVWRCGVVSKYEKVPFTKLLGTMLVDRVMDAIVVGLITLFLAIFNIGFFKQYLASHPAFLTSLQYTFTSIWLYAGVLVVAVLIWMLFAKWGHLAFVQKVKNAVLNIWEGIKSLWKMEQKIRFIVQTILIWSGYFLYFYITFYAFDFTSDLGPRVGLIAFTMSSIAVAVPVQGGIGVWHFMVISTLVIFGVSETDASAFALVVYTIQTVSVVLAGLAGILALPFVNRKTSDKK